MLDDTEVSADGFNLNGELCHIRCVIKADSLNRVSVVLVCFRDDIPVLDSLAVSDDLRNFREHHEEIPRVCPGDTDGSVKVAIHVVIHRMLDTSDSEHFWVACLTGNPESRKLFLKSFYVCDIGHLVEVLSQTKPAVEFLQEVEDGRHQGLLTGGLSEGLIRDELLRNQEQVLLLIEELPEGREFCYIRIRSESASGEGIPQAFGNQVSLVLGNDISRHLAVEILVLWADGEDIRREKRHVVENLFRFLLELLFVLLVRDNDRLQAKNLREIHSHHLETELRLDGNEVNLLHNVFRFVLRGVCLYTIRCPLL